MIHVWHVPSVYRIIVGNAVVNWLCCFFLISFRSVSPIAGLWDVGQRGDSGPEVDVARFAALTINGQVTGAQGPWETPQPATATSAGGQPGVRYTPGG